ncbi:MAG: hypothetical protein B7Z73_19460, partial [Planctomycetia bacterium 21-64-5]
MLLGPGNFRFWILDFGFRNRSRYVTIQNPKSKIQNRNAFLKRIDSQLAGLEKRFSASDADRPPQPHR